MKLDSHQHFWHYKAEEYDWMGPGMEDLQSHHLPANLFPLLAAARIDGTIAVQARQTPEETRWLLSLARQHAFIKGVVGWVDLCSPDVREQLARFGADPKFVGVRHVVHDEADDKFMLQESFIRGIGALAEFGLTYDLLLFPQHLPVACELVARFPEQPFILDHIAKPSIKDGVLVPWDAELRRLAAFPNVACKVSGMVTEAAWRDWEPPDFRPYLDVVFEAFGAERIMFGSDWPVCTVAASYREVVSIVTDYVEGLSADERAAVWGGTAARCYGN